MRFAQTLLVRLVVDLLYNLLYGKSTTNPQLIHNKSKRPQQIYHFSINPTNLDMYFKLSGVFEIWVLVLVFVLEESVLSW